jgi:hypothetical protein
MSLHKVVVAGLLSLAAMTLAAAPATRVQPIGVLKDSEAVIKSPGGFVAEAAETCVDTY